MENEDDKDAKSERESNPRSLKIEANVLNKHYTNRLSKFFFLTFVPNRKVNYIIYGNVDSRKIFKTTLEFPFILREVRL